MRLKKRSERKRELRGRVFPWLGGHGGFKFRRETADISYIRMIWEVGGMAIRIPVQDSAPTVAFEDAVQFVFNALGEVPEFRSTRGRQIELHGTLALAVLAMMAGHTTYREIETWGKLREETLIPLLGLVRAPSDSTIRRIVQGVDAEALRGVLRASAGMILSDRRRLVTAKDGKVMPGALRRTKVGREGVRRAARIQDTRSAYMVSVVEHNSGVIMDAERCKLGEGELTAARRLMPKAAAGKAEIVVETTDALYASAPDARRAVDNGEVYLMKIKKTCRTSWKRQSCASSPALPSPTSATPSTSATAV